jgi:hypothetical protein
VNQKLNCKFDDYTELLMDIFDGCENNAEYHDNQLYIHHNRKALLEVQTKNEMRRFVLISLDFVAVPDELVKSSVAYRFSVMKAKKDLLEGRLVDMVRVIKRSNPSLGLMVINSLQNH